MSDRILLVSITGALTRLEKFPGELFPDDKFEFVGLSHEQWAAHDRQWNHNKKICVLHFTHYSCPDFDLSQFDLVLIIDEEALDSDNHRYITNLSVKFQNNNIRIITSGYHQDHPVDTEKIFIYPFFLIHLPRMSQYQPVDSLAHYTKKFDVLLGMVKPHRQFVFDQLARYGMLRDNFVNLTTNRHFDDKLHTIYRSPELWALEEDVVLTNTNEVIDSYHYIDQTGPKISHVIPWRVYEHSLYSIIAETNGLEYLFFSEKTAKALFAKRIFVFFGAAHSLDALRRMGFRTFDEIIDESYDTIRDDQRRYNAAWQQVLYLDAQPPSAVYQRAEKILAHNHNHIQNRDYFVQPLKQWLQRRLQEI